MSDELIDGELYLIFAEDSTEKYSDKETWETGFYNKKDKRFICYYASPLAKDCKHVIPLSLVIRAHELKEALKAIRPHDDPAGCVAQVALAEWENGIDATAEVDLGPMFAEVDI